MPYFRKCIAIVILFLAHCGTTYAEQKAVTRIVVDKSERKMKVFAGAQLLREFTVSLGRNPQGAKQRRGDHKTPEGHYTIDGRNENSRFHKAFHISYPNEADRARAAKASVDPGGDIMIHGSKNGLGWMGSFHRFYDWTDGCIAVTDAEMDEIWDMVPVGTTVEITP